MNSISVISGALPIGAAFENGSLKEANDQSNPAIRKGQESVAGILPGGKEQDHPSTEAIPVVEEYARGRLAFSVRETALALGVSEKTVRRLIDRRLLRVSRALRHILIPRAEIERFLRQTLQAD